jgi:hypothetical protein
MHCFLVFIFFPVVSLQGEMVECSKCQEWFHVCNPQGSNSKLNGGCATAVPVVFNTRSGLFTIWTHNYYFCNVFLGTSRGRLVEDLFYHQEWSKNFCPGGSIFGGPFFFCDGMTMILYSQLTNTQA